MIRILAPLVLLVTACTPSHYMGIATGGPKTATEWRLLEYAANSRQEGKGRCPALGASGEYAPIPCELVPLSDLARLASFGNRHAQLELGKRFENGRGVARDWDRAEKLYQSASKNSGGPIWIYVPGVGGAPGRVQQVDMPVVVGLVEANIALRELREKRGATAPGS